MDALSGEEDGFGVVGEASGFAAGDYFGAAQFDEVLVEEAHAHFLAGDDFRDAEDVSFGEEFSDGGRGAHDFVDGDAGLVVGGFGEALADDGLEAGGEVEEDAGAFIGGEEGGEALECLCGGGGVEGGEDGVSGVGGLESGFDGFAVAHFADEDDVGVLAECFAESVAEAGDVGTEFTLGDE